MTSPPHFPDKLQSILHDILRFQQLCLQTMSECAHTLSTLTATQASPVIPYFGTNTLPWVSQISSHQQSTIINFTHLCSPSPHLHYQELIPSPNPVLSHFAAENSSLKFNLTPLGFSHTSTPFPPISQLSHHQQPIPNTLPWVSSNSFHQQPTLINSPNLSPHSHHIHSPDQIPPLEPTLNDDSAPQYFQPTEKGEGEDKTEMEKNNDASVFLAPTLMSHDKIVETGERSQELVVAAETDLEETIHPDPPSIFLSNAPISTPLFFTPTEKGEKEIAKSQKARLNVVSSGFENQSGTFFAQSPSYSTIKISDSKLCFTFISLAPDPIYSSYFAFETLALATTGRSPAKTNGNTILTTHPQRLSLVFDPDGPPTITMRTVRELQTTVARTITKAAPPPQCPTLVFDPGGYRHCSWRISRVPALCLRMVELCSPWCHRGRRHPPPEAILSAVLHFGTKNRVSPIEIGLAEASMTWASFKKKKTKVPLLWATGQFFFVLSDLHGPHLQFYFVGLNHFIFMGFWTSIHLEDKVFLQDQWNVMAQTSKPKYMTTNFRE